MKCAVMVLASLVFFASCGGQRPDSVATEFEYLTKVDRTGWDVGDYGGTLVFGLFEPPETFNPLRNKNSSVAMVLGQLFRPAVRR